MNDDLQEILDLSPDDRTELSERVGAIERLLRARYGDVALSRSSAYLPLLQQLIDERAISPNEADALQSLGLAFGEVLVHELGLRWVIVKDRYGRDPALRLGDTSMLLFPKTLLSKRLEAGQPTDVASMLESLQAHLRGLTGGGS